MVSEVNVTDWLSPQDRVTDIVSGGLIEAESSFCVEVSVTGVAAVETVASETTSLCVSVEAERSFMVSEEVSVTVSLFCIAGSSVAAGASGSDSDSEPDEESDEISDSVVSGSCAGTSESSSPLSSVSASESFGVLCSGF